MFASLSSGSPSECPFKAYRCVRHLTETEMAMLMLGGMVKSVTHPEWSGPPHWEESKKYPEGVYLCTCGGTYAWDGMV